MVDQNEENQDEEIHYTSAGVVRHDLTCPDELIDPNTGYEIELQPELLSIMLCVHGDEFMKLFKAYDGSDKDEIHEELKEMDGDLYERAFDPEGE